MEKNKPFAPFRLPDQDGALRGLDDYAGKWLVVYFYPKDNTSGCTLEARSFTALAGRFAAEGAAVVGVSPDSVKTHCGFIAKQELGITLLSDPERSLIEAAGAWGKKKLYGKEYMVVVRSTAWTWVTSSPSSAWVTSATSDQGMSPRGYVMPDSSRRQPRAGTGNGGDSTPPVCPSGRARHSPKIALAMRK